MRYDFHGTSIEFDPKKECGVYKQNGICFEYAALELDGFFQILNRLNHETLLQQVNGLKNLVTDQLSRDYAPRNLGYPILLGPHPRVPFSEAKPGLENTLGLTNLILGALLTE